MKSYYWSFSYYWTFSAFAIVILLDVSSFRSRIVLTSLTRSHFASPVTCATSSRITMSKAENPFQCTPFLGSPGQAKERSPRAAPSALSSATALSLLVRASPKNVSVTTTIPNYISLLTILKNHLWTTKLKHKISLLTFFAAVQATRKGPCLAPHLAYSVLRCGYGPFLDAWTAPKNALFLLYFCICPADRKRTFA